MWCPRVRKLFSAFLDGELDSTRQSNVSAHVRHCRWCRHGLRRVERGAKLAQTARQVAPPPPGLSAKSMAMAIQAAGGRSAPRPPVLTRTRWLLPAAALLASLVVMTLTNPQLRKDFWPFSPNSVYALDFGLEPARGDENLLNTFRAKYAGKFREFQHQGEIDPSWVPYSVKSPTQLPAGMRLKSVMIFDPKYCGSLVLNFSDGLRNLHLVQQPAERPISLSGLKTTQAEVFKYNATHGAIGAYRLVTWEADAIRSVLISNLGEREIEGVVESLR
jgi:hypothetical protein